MTGLVLLCAGCHVATWYTFESKLAPWTVKSNCTATLIRVIVIVIVLNSCYTLDIYCSCTVLSSLACPILALMDAFPHLQSLTMQVMIVRTLWTAMTFLRAWQSRLSSPAWYLLTLFTALWCWTLCCSILWFKLCGWCFICETYVFITWVTPHVDLCCCYIIFIMKCYFSVA